MFPLDLAHIWAGLIAFAVLAYVVFDGFDLGIGILFPWLRDRRERHLAMNTIAPVWDGNETWLVLGGGGLLAVFPLAYAVVMPAVYPLIIIMLLGLIFRGVAFEFTFRTKRAQAFWEWGFAIGSLAAAIAQGLILGALVQGITVQDRAFAGGTWDWATPFSALCAVAVLIGYATLGAAWLRMKTDGATRVHATRILRLGLPALIAVIGAVSLATVWVRPEYMQRWFSGAGLVWSVIVPVLVVLAGGIAWTATRDNDRRVMWPFLGVLALFVLTFTGLGISFYPNIVPPGLTIVEAAAPDTSLRFLLVGAAVLIPTILAYTAYSYWVFRGVVDPDQGYH
ncbi:cytochrome d ubiquinol oxidase subunit II [Paracoccus suum]|uniref:Cytochrome d ubiquinol oxidase subunit II n=1 Tax=Paracoccus suum TaxID=2259340 RepID=A0A344PGN0_9RHOB|nr:cytochrome d ubiquinol oxidase subunit II [Paracoccus suum]AXC48535.1 cytochrome d ubiquinol oxidase subunit II [Paracoccus suum]